MIDLVIEDNAVVSFRGDHVYVVGISLACVRRFLDHEMVAREKEKKESRSTAREVREA